MDIPRSGLERFDLFFPSCHRHHRSLHPLFFDIASRLVRDEPFRMSRTHLLPIQSCFALGSSTYYTYMQHRDSYIAYAFASARYLDCFWHDSFCECTGTSTICKLPHTWLTIRLTLSESILYLELLVSSLSMAITLILQQSSLTNAALHLLSWTYMLPCARYPSSHPGRYMYP
jgi:hypothetical protein